MLDVCKLATWSSIPVFTKHSSLFCWHSFWVFYVTGIYNSCILASPSYFSTAYQSPNCGIQIGISPWKRNGDYLPVWSLFVCHCPSSLPSAPGHDWIPVRGSQTAPHLILRVQSMSGARVQVQTSECYLLNFPVSGAWCTHVPTCGIQIGTVSLRKLPVTGKLMSIYVGLASHFDSVDKGYCRIFLEML